MIEGSHIEVSLPLDKVALRFPVAMFRADGRSLHRIERSTFLRQMATLYDTYAEEARQRVIAEDGTGTYPPLENLGTRIYDLVEVKTEG